MSGFRDDVNEVCALPGLYAAYSGNFVPTFRDNLLVSSSGVKKSNFPSWFPSHLKMGPTSCPKMSVRDYRSTLRKIPEEHRSYVVTICRNLSLSKVIFIAFDWKWEMFTLTYCDCVFNAWMSDTRTVKKIFNLKPLTKRSQARPKYRWDGNIKQDIC